MTEAEKKIQEDRELVEAFQKGDETAFSELMRRYKEKALQLALVTVGNYEDAKDVAQEAFVKIHKTLGKFERRSEFSTWFYRVLMNTAKDFMRRKRWISFLMWKKNDAMENYFETLADKGRSPGEDMMNTELGVKMTEAVKRLPFQQQWIFTLRYLKGFSLQQIAEVTELSEGTVKATLHFAVQKFKKEISPYLGGEGE